MKNHIQLENFLSKFSQLPNKTKTKSWCRIPEIDFEIDTSANKVNHLHSRSISHTRPTKSCHASPRNKKCLNKREVLANFELSQFEKNEIEALEEVFYLGCNRFINEFYLDDNTGAYMVYLDDHLNYRYQILDFLGEGTFGTVVKCYDHKLGELVAIKIFKNDPIFNDCGKNESEILTILNNQDKNCVVQKLSEFEFRGHLCLVFELLSVDLYQFLKKNNFKGLHSNFVKRVVIQLLIALKDAHSNNIVHCDLKPENIVLTSENKSKIKLIDFGSAWKPGQHSFDYIQSRYYRSPEVILECGWCEKIDIWSLGCLTVELLIGRPLFVAATETGLLFQQVNILGCLPRNMFNQGKKSEHLSFESLKKNQVLSFHKHSTLEGILQNQSSLLIDFVKKCLQWTPEARPSAEEALRHPWIRANHKVSN